MATTIRPRTILTALALVAAVLALAMMLRVPSAPAEELYGTVRWARGSDNYPIAFAEVTACRLPGDSDCHVAVTGSDGSFSLVGITPGRYELDIRYDGGARQEVVDVAEGRPTAVEIVSQD